MLSDHGCVTSHWDSIPLLIKGRRSNPCKLTLRKHKRDRNGKGVLRSCPPTLRVSGTTLHLCGSSSPHVSTEPPSEHPHPMSPQSHPLSIVKLSLTEDSPERVLDLMKSENNAGLSAGHHVLLKHWRTQAAEPLLMSPLTLKVIGHQQSTHRASQSLWPT